MTIFLGHAIIDYFKVHNGKSHPITAFVLDQLAHLIVLGILFLCLCDTQFIVEIQNKMETFISNSHIWIVVCGYLLILTPVSTFMKILLKPWKGQVNKEEANKEIQDGELEKAGKRIGYLERILIITFILNHEIEAVGFLLAAKSVFRFGDLKDKNDIKHTEYVLVGTLTSFTIAIFVGYAMNYLLG